MHSGISLNRITSIEEIKKNQNGGVGTLIHQYGVFLALNRLDNQIDCINFYQKIKNINELVKVANEYDLVVFSLGDCIKPSFFKSGMIDKLTTLIKEIKTKCLFIGIGVQRVFQMSEEKYITLYGKSLTNFISACVSKSPMGIRCKYSANIFEKLGFVNNEHFYVLGCPSAYIHGDNLVIPEKFPDIANIDNVSITRNFNTSIAKERFSFYEEIMQKYKYTTFNSWTYEFLNYYENTTKYGIDTQCKLDKKEMDRLHYDLSIIPTEYIYKMQNYDIHIGERIHGCMSSIAAGVPTILIAVDYRMQGLAEYHHIPYIKINDLMEIKSLEELLNSIKYNMKDMHDIHKINFKKYCDFYKKLKVKTIWK